MMRILVVPVLLAACAAAQVQTPAPKPATPAPVQPPPVTAHPETVGATDAVITIRGFCPQASGKTGAECVTVINKEQFEKVLAAVNQSNAVMPAAAIRNLAERYVQLMAFASQAEKLGLDKDPRFLELMRVVRLNSLAETYRRAMDEKSRNLPDADVQAYYDKNISRYEQIKLGRVFIPRINPKAPAQGIDDFAQRAQKLADSMRERAANGEELDKLQQEAYRALGLPAPALNTDAGTKRRGTGNLSPTVEADVFALKSGEVSKVEPEPGGFQFYKLLSRETLPLAQVKAEIVATLRKEQLEAAIKTVTDPIHTDLNETYFGPRNTAPVAAPATRGTLPHQAIPSAAPAAPPDKSSNKPVEP